MATQLFRNNASSALAVSLAPSDTVVQVGSGLGALFPSPGAGEFFMIAIEDTLGNIEFCRCTSRSSDLLTVTRAQEGTSALTFTAPNARVEIRLTRASVERFVQQDSGVVSINLEFTGVIELPLTTTLDGGALWGAANDGTGSGLDADLLDGFHASAFPRLATANSYTETQTITKADSGIAIELVGGNGRLRLYGSSGFTSFLIARDLADSAYIGLVIEALSVALPLAVTVDGVSVHDAAILTTGTIPAARVGQSAVTQHEAALAINTDQLVTDGTDESGTSRTLGAGDAESIIRTSSSSTVTITLPQVPTGWADNDSAAVFRNGTGQVNFAAGSGASILSRNSLLGINARYACVVATYNGSGVWQLSGDLG